MEDFMKEEVENAVKCLKKGKAPGVDSITAEMLQAAKAGSVEVLHFLLHKIYQEENCQADWGKAVIVSLYKKGNKMVGSN